MPLLIFIYATAIFLETVFRKLNSNNFADSGKATQAVYFSVHSFVACIFFSVSGGFRLNLNLYTVLYSVFLGLILICNMLLSLYILKRMNILGAGIIASPFNIMLVTFLGAAIFQENISYGVYIRIGLMILAAAFIYLDIRSQEKKRGEDKSTGESKLSSDSIAQDCTQIADCNLSAGSTNRDGKPTSATDLKKYIPLMIFSVCLSALQVLTLKAFSVSEKVTDESSFFLFTNVIMLAFGILLFLFEFLRSRENLRPAIDAFRPKKLIPTVGNVVCANVSTLALVPILKEINVSVYEPVRAAYSIVISVVASIIFREKLGKLSYAAAIVAIIAMATTV